MTDNSSFITYGSKALCKLQVCDIEEAGSSQMCQVRISTMMSTLLSEVFPAFLSAFRQISGYCLKLGYNHLLPDIFQVIFHY
jgi:hypothetical protein